MRALTSTALVLALALAGACSNEQKTATTNETTAAPATAKAVDLTPEQLGELGAQIRKEPSRADEILSQKGLDQATFEKAIRDVTENPEASKRYAEAYRKASA
jgi:hypothetical protein